VAAEEREEAAGSDAYQDNHMAAIFKEGFSFSGYERDFLALNRGDGTYLNISGVSGLDSITDGRGSVFGDFDNDGDADVLLTTAQHEAHHLFRNNIGNKNGFVRVTLTGTSSGTDAFGAVVRVKTSAGVQTKLKSGGSGYLSQHDPRLLFGLADDERAEWVEVRWPDTTVQRFENVPAGSSIRIVEGGDAYVALAEKRFTLVDPLSRDETLLAGLGFEMHAPFPDLALRTLDGAETNLAEVTGNGRRTLVNLWATWCVPCASEIPELLRLHPDLQRAGVDLVGLSVDLETVDAVPDYVRAKSVTYPVYTTDEAGLETLYPRGDAAVPLTILLDGEGRVLEVHSGWSPRSAAALERLAGQQ
jgi:thiol-disulfide isomerase/thioredoxin